MDTYDRLCSRDTCLAVIGLGYVGLPLAIEFSKYFDVIGYDNNNEKINLLNQRVDYTQEVGGAKLEEAEIVFTCEEKMLKKAIFFVIAVPTPLDGDNMPDLGSLKKASKLVGRNMTKDSIVVYESTVYPGVTEEICLPILEKESNMRCGISFKVGYSPERINPGDKIHKVNNIVKVVAGIDKESLNIISKVYKLIIKAGVHEVENIKTAEAVKIIENTQRDINIAFMNEAGNILRKMHIDTNSVLEAMATKWNALDFKPGLVGGHCIGVDPYYLIYASSKIGYLPSLLVASREINDSIGGVISAEVIKAIIKYKKNLEEIKIGILGFTFKEDCSDIRNTRVKGIVDALNEYGISPMVVDPIADKEEVWKEYKIQLREYDELEELDIVILAVAHSSYRQLIYTKLDDLYKREAYKNKILFDLKGILNKKELVNQGYCYWSL